MRTRVRRVVLAVGIIALVSLGAVGVLTGILPAGVQRALSATGVRGSDPGPASGSARGGSATPGSSPAASANSPAGPVSSPSSGSPSSGAPSSGASGGAPSGQSSAGGPSPVLVPASTDAAVNRSALAKRIAAVDTKGLKGSIGAEVMDLSSGTVLYNRSGTRGFTPASTNKLLTSVAALDLLGPGHRFATTVVQGSGDHIILVGGGDPYLATRTDPSVYPARPSLQQLAVRTATALKTAKRSKVTLGYDASLFSGPAWNTHWPDAYRDQVTPVSALWADEGRTAGYSPGPRTKDPAGDAADAFAAALKKQGITVSTPTATKARGSDVRIASVSSLPLEVIVERLLMASDNDAAEVVFRQAALAAKQPGSFVGGEQAVKTTLTRLGVWDSATRIYDGSGLSRETRVPPDTLVKVLRAAASTGNPELRAVITGLPIAGVAGSLRLHFTTDQTTAGRGLVRAKTGTLRQVHALAGYARTANGATVLFSFVVNDAKNEYVAQIWLERVTTAVATCSCGS